MRGFRVAAFSEGDHVVVLVDKAGTQARRSVRVTAGRTAVLDVK